MRFSQLGAKDASKDKKADASAGGTEKWKTYAMYGGGAAAVGGLVYYFFFRKKGRR